MKKFYNIKQIGNNNILVTILTTEGTSVYWHALKSQLNRREYANKSVFFDFMYRNGFQNRFFCAHIIQTDAVLSQLCRCEESLAEVEREADRFFAHNIRFLEGSALTELQRNSYVYRIRTYK